MSTCENPSLPQELLLAIVDNIREDKKSLKAFSLVCKAWTDAARDRLFASLNISNLEGLEKIKAANIASSYAPHLRHLQLTAFYFHHKFWQDVIPFLADFTTPRLQNLTLTELAWHSLSADERSALLRRFESIVSLELSLYQQDTSNEIASIICSFPHLDTLILRPSLHRRVILGPTPSSPELRLPKRLSTLRVSYFSHDYRFVLEWLGSIPEQLSIHTFYITMGGLLPHDVDSVNKFLKALGASLEVLECETDDEHPSIDLTCNTHLRSIDFRFSGSEHNSGDVLSAMATLSRIGSQQLEQVVFHIPCWENGFFPMAEWIQMDVMLASPQFMTLKDVRIYSFSFSPAVTYLSTLFATSLPICHARGIASLVDSGLWEL